MKKTAAVLACCLLTLLLAGCFGAHRLQLGFTAAETERIYITTGSVPTLAQRMTVTEPEDIEAIVSTLERLTLLREAEDDDVRVGGIGFILHFVFQQGGSFTLRLNGDLLLVNDTRYVVKGGEAFDQLYALLGYETSAVIACY